MPMVKEYYQTEEQLFGLYRFLVLLRNDKIYWHEVVPSGDKIKVIVEEQKGEFDLKVFYLHENGEAYPDDFRD